MKASQTILLLLYGLILLLPAGMAPLTETTEARYGEIAREMLVTGNFIEPQFNGIKHFHKPPFAYWAMAGGMRLFGQNDFGVRFFGVVAAVIAVVFVFRMARVVLEQERQAQHAAIIFATSLLLLAVARVASTDIYLTACTAAAQFYLFRQIYGERRRCNAVLYGFWLGLGFLTKGPIILLFTILPSLVAKLVDPRHRRVFSLGEAVFAALIFAVVALPWYLLVIAQNPDLLGYFLKTQTVDRVVTNRFSRYQPPWYFLYIFAATFLPYLLFLLKGVRHVRDMERPVRLLLLYLGIPLLVFSLAESKLPTYILPFYGVASLFAAASYDRFPMPRIRDLVMVLTVLLVLALPITALVVKPLTGTWKVVLVASALPGLILAWRAYRMRRETDFLAWVAGVLLLFGTTGYVVYGVMTHDKRGYERLVQQINAEDPGRELPVMVYRDLVPSVSFYRGELAVMAMGEERETQFEQDSGYRDHYLRDEDEIETYLQNVPEFFLVVAPKYLEEFTTRFRVNCRELYHQRKEAAYRCRNVGKGA